MYDPLTSTYSFACPHERGGRVAVSSFRLVDTLPGASHPAVFRVVYACRCGDEHEALVTHEDLDWAPLGLGTPGTFVNLMTHASDSLAVELGDVAAAHIRAGEWPWSFYCDPEACPRPVTPSAFAAIAPCDGAFGLAVRCPACSSLSVNLVSREHLDVPFRNDPRVGVVDHVFRDDALRVVDEFRVELASARFDERRIDLQR